MAQWVKSLFTKTEGLNSIPGTHMVGSDSSKFLSDLHSYTHIHICTHIYVHTKQNAIKIKLKTILLFYGYKCFACMCVYICVCVYALHASWCLCRQEWVLGSLELEFQPAVMQGVELRTDSETSSHRYESQRTCSLSVIALWTLLHFLFSSSWTKLGIFCLLSDFSLWRQGKFSNQMGQRFLICSLHFFV